MSSYASSPQFIDAKPLDGLTRPDGFTPPDGLTLAPNGVEYLCVSQWNTDQAWLSHGFSTRRGGVSRAYLPEFAGEEVSGELNLGYTGADSRENVLENRKRFVEAITGTRTTPLITVRQIHSNRSVVADTAIANLTAAEHTGTPQAQEADGLITSQAGILIGIQTADCIPVLVADPQKRVVGAFHAGWRGTVRRIVELGVERMCEEFGANAGEMIAAIGPGIGACCYTVGEEVRKEFGEQFAYAAYLFTKRTSGRVTEIRLDLIEANRRQLLEAGLRAECITVVGGCTACQPKWFYSHRASHGHAGRMMAVIGIR